MFSCGPFPLTFFDTLKLSKKFLSILQHTVPYSFFLIATKISSDQYFYLSGFALALRAAEFLIQNPYTADKMPDIRLFVNNRPTA